MSFVVGVVDIGGTKIAAGIVRNGRIESQGVCPTAPERGPTEGLRRISELLRACGRQTGLEMDGIGVGCTGPINALNGVIGAVDLLPGWQGFPLGDQVSAEFGVPVATENDADAAALGEYFCGDVGDCESFIYVSVGTGIGAGVVLSGRLYRGVGGSHPELGHQTLDASGPPCYCGARGCWEMLASGPALLREARIQFQKTGRSEPLVSARQVCDLAREGSPEARRAVSQVAVSLGLGLANLVTTFCPDRIALGGGLMQAADLFLNQAQHVVSTHCGLVPFEKTRIAPASLGTDAALLGASQVWLRRRAHQTGIAD